MKKTIGRIFLLAGVIALSACGSMETASQWKETRALRENYEVVSTKVTGESSYNQIVLLIIPIGGWGDNSYDSAELKALQEAKGSDDLINVSLDVSASDYIFFRRFTTVLNGTAIKYTSNGKSELCTTLK